MLYLQIQRMKQTKLTCKYCGNWIEIYGEFQWVVCACGEVMDEPLGEVKKRRSRALKREKSMLTELEGGKQNK